MPGPLRVMRGAALIAVVGGAAGSVSLMLRAGHPPLVLRILFTGWVLLPFVALALAGAASTRWSVPARTAIYGVTFFVTLGSLAFYGHLVPMPAASKPAFLFLVVPLVSLILLTIVTLAGLWSRR